MNLDQLRYLVDLASTGSMNTTAKNMYISQPAISDSVKRLEKELDCTLLHRHKNGITFTRDGELVLESARRILREQDALLSALRNRSEEQQLQADITICIGYSAEELFFSPFLQEMYATYPNIHLQIMEVPLSHYLEPDLSNMPAFGLYAFSESTLEHLPTDITDHFHLVTLYREPVIAVMSNGHPLAGNRELTNADLQKYPSTAIGVNSTNYIPRNIAFVSPNIMLHKQNLLNTRCTMTVPMSIYLENFNTKEFTAKYISDSQVLCRCLLYPKQQDNSLPAGFQQLIDTAVRFASKIDIEAFRKPE